MAFGRSSKSDDPGTARPAGRSAAPAAGESLIASGTVLRGDVYADGMLRVEGHVTGSIEAGRLTIARGGRVDGDVTSPAGNGDQAVLIDGRVGGAVRATRVEVGREGAVGSGMVVKEATVRGRVAGGIESDGRLLLEETAIVQGDVVARRLGLREGGQVFGTIRIGERPRDDDDAAAGPAASGPEGGEAAGESAEAQRGVREAS